MEVSGREDVTRLLVAWRDGSDQALDTLIPIVYSELRRLARSQLRGERPCHTLQPTALTHEVFLRLFDYRRVCWKSRAHFFATTAQLMRRILVEHARRRRAAKRGGQAIRVALDDTNARTDPLDIDLLALDEALHRLEATDSRQCRVVELRYFGGLNEVETANVLEISPTTVKRDWIVAKLYLRRALARSVPS